MRSVLHYVHKFQFFLLIDFELMELSRLEREATKPTNWGKFFFEKELSSSSKFEKVLVIINILMCCTVS